MTVLGAVLAGGQSRRFGSDKADAMLGGARLIDRVIAALAPQVDRVVVVGRSDVPDRPAPGLGPLGGLNAALHRAVADGYASVVTVPCDAPRLPADLVEQLWGEGPGFAAAMPVIGWWPITLAEQLDRHLATTDDRSMRAWTRLIDARAVDLGDIDNINTAEDLARLSARSGAPPPA